jgi:hypothetical protein
MPLLQICPLVSPDKPRYIRQIREDLERCYVQSACLFMTRCASRGAAKGRRNSSALISPAPYSLSKPYWTHCGASRRDCCGYRRMRATIRHQGHPGSAGPGSCGPRQHSCAGKHAENGGPISRGAFRSARKAVMSNELTSDRVRFGMEMVLLHPSQLVCLDALIEDLIELGNVLNGDAEREDDSGKDSCTYPGGA